MTAGPGAMRRPSARLRAAVAGACLAALVACSAPARAEGEGPFPLVLLGMLAGGVGLTSLPYIVLADRKDPGEPTVSLGMGAGGHHDAFVLHGSYGGFMHEGGVFGWMGRVREDLAGADPINHGSMAWRFDMTALFNVVDDWSRRVALDALAGLTVWPWVVTIAGGHSTPYIGVGPTVGLRVRAATRRPWIAGELEVDYAALFGEAPTRKVHNVELGPALAFAPWPSPSGVCVLELRARFEIGLGGEDAWRTAGASVIGGLRFRVDRFPKR